MCGSLTLCLTSQNPTPVCCWRVCSWTMYTSIATLIDGLCWRGNTPFIEICTTRIFSTSADGLKTYVISHWCSVDTSSFTEPQQLSSISLSLWHYWAMHVISSTWFGPQVSYQILKSLAFSLWSEFWRHRNDFTISDYYSSVKVIKHHQHRKI